MFIRRAIFLVVIAVSISTITACSGPPPSSAPHPSEATLDNLAKRILEETYTRQPTQATDLGIHTHDAELEDYSKAGVESELAALRQFRTELAAIDPVSLSQGPQLDREQLLHAVDSRILTREVIRPWAKDPDTYSSGLTNTAYVMIKRNFAPVETRLRALIAREKLMPAALAEARKNLDNPPRIYTEIAIEQIDGNRDFFKTAVPGAFTGVKDTDLMKQFAAANTAVIAALDDYKKWLQQDLLPRSKGEFALGADTYAKKLWDDEMIDASLDDLLRIAERDLKKNQDAFAATAKLIDPKKTPMEVLALVQRDHPPADKLLSTTQAELDALGRFMADHHIVTVPKAETARVQETPPFLRATTTASMDTPGPFEKVATEAYYSMTLPDPKWSKAETEDFMKQWYYAAISNVSVHEVWPGHYLQFLYARTFPSDIRKVFGAASNSEGWAHYCEQMVIDEGFHADDPKYRLAQLQDALLRNARFIVGIKMHTRGMTMAEAQEFFQKEGYQPLPVAKAETKRGTSDATYGYYTMGKLMILKLRADYMARQEKTGGKATLQDFHDAFIKIGPLPLPLIRRAMLGEIGQVF